MLKLTNIKCLFLSLWQNMKYTEIAKVALNYVTSIIVCMIVPWFQDYKTLFMLNSAEHEITTADKKLDC